MSHHRRLARQPEAHRGVVMLNLLFLLTIVLLPVSNGLDANYGKSSAVAVLFGLHLTVIASLNAVLWWMAVGGWRHDFIAALAPILVLVPGTIVAGIAPQYASYLWLLAFGALLIRRASGSPSPSG